MSTPNDINESINSSVQSSTNPLSEPRIVVSNKQVVRRYQDAYIIAKTANAFSNFTKTLGIIIAGAIGVIGIVTMMLTMKSFDNPGVGFILFFTALALGIIFGAIFHILGIVLSVLGQNLMATLDAAVNGSPFMTQEQKAQAMNLV